MTGGEYLLGLILIITGLAISDMVVSLHGVLLNRRTVKWDWLALAAAAYVFLMIVNSWGISFQSFARDSINPTLWQFLELLGQIIPLYLAARAALPDDCAGDECDLAAHYALVRRYLWSAIGLTLALYLVGSRYISTEPMLGFFQARIGAAAQLALIISILVVGSRTWDRRAVPALIAIFAYDHLTQPLFG